MKRKFHIASEDEILNGETTDVYFLRTEKVLRDNGLENVHVTVEITASSLPNNYKWGILAGIEEVANLLEGKPIDVYSMPEGSVFYPLEPVIKIQGKYVDFAKFETPILGLICQASGIATRAARIKKLAMDKLILSFGIRRMHPAIAPMIDRATYIGGFDGFSGVLAEKILNIPSSGTMPHALILIYGSQKAAWKAFHEKLPKEIPRVALVDTLADEKFEAIMAAEALGKNLTAVRLDTPGSRRGNFKKIIEEVRWELDIRGYNHVKIFISGGITEDTIRELLNAPVDGFGVGTYVSSSPTVDFALDIVEKEKVPYTKRGKLSGSKQVWECPNCLLHKTTLFNASPPKCSKCNVEMKPLLQPLIKNGKIVTKLPDVREIREKVISQLKHLELND